MSADRQCRYLLRQHGYFAVNAEVGERGSGVTLF
jgi:hypothetical protein